MNAAIYIRVSTKEQNATTQLKDILASYPAAKAADIITEKQSAWKDHLKVRPKFKALKTEISKNKYSALYVWDLDRLYRNQTAAVSFLQFCDFYNCQVYSHRQKFLNEFEGIPEPWGSMVKDIIIKLLAWVAEDESNKRSDRIQKSIVRKDGVTTSYKGNKWGRPTLDIDNVKILYLHNQGYSIRSIAAELDINRGKVYSVIKTLSKK